MRTSTKFFIVIFLLTALGSVLTFNALLDSFYLVNGKFVISFTTITYFALAFNLLNILSGNILFVKFLKSRNFNSMLFFMVAPMFIMFGVVCYILSSINNFSGKTFGIIKTALNISTTNYNNYLWIILTLTTILCLLYFTLSIASKPIKKLEIVTKKLSYGEVKEKISVGGNRQFEDIEKSLNKINNILKNNESDTNTTIKSVKFIPKQLIKYLGKKSMIDFMLGEQIKKTATILFCNIKSSDLSNRNMTIEENFNYTNSYLNIIAPIIKKNGGYIDKYLDDGILSVFLSPINAINCSLLISRAIKQKNAEQKDIPALCVGISLHTDEMLFGIVGDENKKYPTILTSYLDIISKMQDINRVFGTTMLATKQFTNENGINNFSFRKISNVYIDSNDYIEVFECLDSYSRQKKNKLKKCANDFEIAVNSYIGGNFEEAKQIFEKVYQKEKEDKACYVYYNLCCENLGNAIINVHE